MVLSQQDYVGGDLLSPMSQIGSLNNGRIPTGESKCSNLDKIILDPLTVNRHKTIVASGGSN